MVVQKATPTRAASLGKPAAANLNGQLGVVKSYNGSKGFGFISYEGSASDVFFSRNELPADAREVRGTFLEGRTVTFDSAEGPDGRQKATAVQVPFIEGLPLAGCIKSFSEKNGYGFITSSALPDDVRFMQRDLQVQVPGSRLKGELVTFEVQSRPDGKLSVSKLQFQTAKIAERIQGQAQGMGAGAGLQALAGLGITPEMFVFGGASPAAAAPSFGGGGKMTGKVKSYSGKNGYGFINTPGHPVDIKFNKTDLSGATSLTPGSNVSFTLVTLPDGRVQAKQVSPNGFGGGMKRSAAAALPPFGAAANPLLALAALVAGGALDVRPAKQMRTSAGPKVQGLGTPTGKFAKGTIKSYNVQKGFGFITSPAIPGGDVFFMKSSLPAEVQETPLQNIGVSFELVYAPDGKARAQGVTLG